MQGFVRGVVAALVFAAVYFFSFWLFFVQIVPDGVMWLATLLALLAAALAARWVWRRMGEGGGGVFTTALQWAAIAGAAGFCGGFFGPMIFAPEANQGPMLGLFITGPLGFIGGGAAGLAYALWRRRGGAA